MRFNKVIKLIIALLALIAIMLVSFLGFSYLVIIKNAMSENMVISYNNVLTIFSILAIFVLFSFTFYKLNKIKFKKNVKNVILAIFLILYIIIQVLWINIRNANPNYDQYYVYNIAVEISEGNIGNLTQKDYLQMYPQQISLSSFYAFIFKILNTSNIKLLQYMNVIANCFTAVGLYLIMKIIANKENTKSVPAFIFLTFTFIPMIMLSTFIYGDLISLAFATFAIYYAIKYNKQDKTRYLFISAILMSLSYFFRMNMLIFFIAICIYLILELVKYITSENKKRITNESNDINDKIEIKKCKARTLIKILLIIAFIIISIVPTTIFKSYMQKKMNLDNSKAFPIIGFIDLGLSYSSRAPGWYLDSYVDTWKIDGHNTKPMIDRINEQLQNFKSNPKECFWFYIMKISSMWVENSFGSIWYNLSFNFGDMSVNRGLASEAQIENYNKVDTFLYDNYNIFIMYDKIIVMFIYLSSLLFILRNKDISNEQILLILIFLGGFLFHIFWEGKSRYVLPYVIILIPIASISINQNVKWVKSKIDKFQEKTNKILLKLEKSK